MAGILDGQVAVVTGSGRGIGKGVALLLAAEGARVVVNDLGCAVDGSGQDTMVADQVVAEIKASGGTAVANYDSVATMEGGQRIIQSALQHFGRIDILVNNAGILRDRMVFNMTEAEWDIVVSVHLKGMFSCTKAAVPHMLKQKYGRIICLTSGAGLFGNPGQANYAAAKDAIAGLVRSLARELRGSNVTVNSISPSAATRMTLSPEVLKAAEIRRAKGVAGGTGWVVSDFERDPSDIAPVAVLLCSPEAANITGRIIYVRQGLVTLLDYHIPDRELYCNEEHWTPAALEEALPTTLVFQIPNLSPSQPAPQPKAG